MVFMRQPGLRHYCVHCTRNMPARTGRLNCRIANGGRKALPKSPTRNYGARTHFLNNAWLLLFVIVPFSLVAAQVRILTTPKLHALCLMPRRLQLASRAVSPVINVGICCSLTRIVC